MLVQKKLEMVGKMTAKMPNTHTHGSKQGTISENATRCPVGYAVICVSDSLQKSKTLVVEGENFNFRLPQSTRCTRRWVCCPISIRFPLCGIAWQLRNFCCKAYWYFQRKFAYSELQVRKFWLLGKNAFCLRSMDAEPRFNAYNCDVKFVTGCSNSCC